MHKKFLFFIFLSFFSLIFLSFNPVVTADLCDILLSDFDDVAAGRDWGNQANGNATGVFDYENVGTVDYFQISTDHGLASTNSLEVSPLNGNNAQGWLNSTTSFEYVHSINISFYIDNLENPDWCEIQFYDGVNLVLDLRFYQGYLQNYDDVGYDTVGSSTIVTNTRYYLVVTHLGLNNFNFTVYDSSFAIRTYEENSGCSTNDWVHFDDVYFDANEGDNDGVEFCFDNFYIDYCESEGDYCENLNLVLFSQDDEPGIRSVILDTVVVYNYTLVGDVGARVWMWITDQDTPGIPLHIYYMGEIPAVGVLAGSHNVLYNSLLYSEQTYSLIVKDFPTISPVCTTYFYEIENFTVNSSTVYNFTDSYFAEFQYLKYNPALVYDSIDIVYRLPENGSASTIYQDYYYLISLWRNGEMYDYKYMYVNQYKLNQTIYDNGGLGRFEDHNLWDTYQLKVYNCSSFTGRSSYSHVYGIYYGTLIYESAELVVYRTYRDYITIISGQEPEHNDTSDLESPFVGLLDEDFGMLMGFVVCLSIACFVGYVTMSGFATGITFIGSLMFFSLPNTSIQIFGNEVLAITGFILVLILMVLVFKR